MVNEMTLDRIYGAAPSNLECFSNPLFGGRRQRFLTDQEMVERADAFVQLIGQKHPDVLLYADTGAWPLAYMCRSLIKKSKTHQALRHVAWQPIKCPRESVGTYEDVILSLLSPAEKAEREASIREHAHDLNALFAEKAEASLIKILASLENPSPIQDAYGEILRGTAFGKRISSRVVYVDEYMDSGVTLSNAANVLKCFNPKVRIQVVAYHAFASRKDLENHSVAALYSTDDGMRAFWPGAYPYENRLDIIGKYYVRHDAGLEKIAIPDLWKQLGKVRPDEDAILKFLDACVSCIRTARLRESVNAKCASRELVASGVIDELEVLRYMVYLFELSVGGDKKYADVLWNLFDMFGPAWSPLPDAYHLDFWNAFSLLRKELSEMPEFPALAKRYEGLRLQMIRGIVRLCAHRHAQWKRGIRKLIHSHASL